MFHVPARRRHPVHALGPRLEPVADALFTIVVLLASILVVAALALWLAAQAAPTGPAQPTPRIYLRPGPLVAEAGSGITGSIAAPVIACLQLATEDRS